MAPTPPFAQSVLLRIKGIFEGHAGFKAVTYMMHELGKGPRNWIAQENDDARIWSIDRDAGRSVRIDEIDW